MTTAQVVEMSVTVNNNSPIQDYVHLEDKTQPTILLLFLINIYGIMHHGLQLLMRKVYCAKVAIILDGKDVAPLLVLGRVSPSYSESFYLILHIVYTLCPRSNY